MIRAPEMVFRFISGFVKQTLKPQAERIPNATGHARKKSPRPFVDRRRRGSVMDDRGIRAAWVSAISPAQRVRSTGATATTAHHRDHPKTRRNFRSQYASTGDERAGAVGVRSPFGNWR